jgi:hypothetical protein
LQREPAFVTGFGTASIRPSPARIASSASCSCVRGSRNRPARRRPCTWR